MRPGTNHSNVLIRLRMLVAKRAVFGYELQRASLELILGEEEAFTTVASPIKPTAMRAGQCLRLRLRFAAT